MLLRTLVRLALAAAAVGLAGFYFVTTPSIVSPASLPTHVADLNNGRTLFNVGGCASCHSSSPRTAPLELGGGHALKTMFGTFVSPNISSDRTFGIGAWSEAEFVTAMTKGVGRSGEHLYPVFPYASYQRMPVNDVRDLFAYIKTLPAVQKANEPHAIAFPFNIRRTLGVWKFLFLDGKPFEPRVGDSAALNRGAYLVEGPGHCAECHSRRNLLGAIAPDGRMAGGPNPEGRGFIPNISQHPADGLADWTVRDFEQLLLSGATPNGVDVGDEMADVVRNTAQLSAADRSAMAEYLKTLPSRPGRPVTNAR